jgi:outer membrane receptor protein involved in Fe transport
MAKQKFLNGDYSNNPITANFNNAVDAVVNPANNQIVCRSTLTNPANGCVPYNVFGTSKRHARFARLYLRPVLSEHHDQAGRGFGIASRRALLDLGGPRVDRTRRRMAQESYAAATTALDQTNAFFLGNFRPSKGHYDVKEGFFETVVPLLKDKPFFREVDFNGAVRYTSYSLSGDVTSWKVGLTWDVDSQLRLRGTRSRDIRAPNLAELFQAGNNLNQTINDPVLNRSYSVQQFASGNPNLAPEKADTTSAGIVYRPKWLPGFGISVDYFDIKMSKAIYSNTAQASSTCARAAMRCNARSSRAIPPIRSRWSSCSRSTLAARPRAVSTSRRATVATFRISLATGADRSI